MNYRFSNHAWKRFGERLSISQKELIHRLKNQSIVECFEKEVTRYLIYCPEEKEFFIIPVSKTGEIVSILPLIWRAKGVSSDLLNEARRLAGETYLAESPLKLKGESFTPKTTKKITIIVEYFDKESSCKRFTFDLSIPIKDEFDQFDQNYLDKINTKIMSKKINTECILSVQGFLDGKKYIIQ